MRAMASRHRSEDGGDRHISKINTEVSASRFDMAWGLERALVEVRVLATEGTPMAILVCQDHPSVTL